MRESENQFEIARDRLIVRHAEIEDALARKAARADEGLRLVVEVGDDGGVRRLYRPEPESASAANAGQSDRDSDANNGDTPI